jgi:hypothetical protein
LRVHFAAFVEQWRPSRKSGKSIAGPRSSRKTKISSSSNRRSANERCTSSIDSEAPIASKSSVVRAWTTAAFE